MFVKLDNSNCPANCVKSILFFRCAYEMYVLFPAFKICNVFQYVSLITTSLETVVCNCALLFLHFPRKLSINGRKWPFFSGQRLSCHNVSVILSAAISPSELRINKGSILERFYLTRNCHTFHDMLMNANFIVFFYWQRHFLTYCYSKCCFTG